MTTAEAEAALQAWATVERDELVHAAHQAGVSKNRIHAVTGIARTTIDRILEAPVGTPQQQITAYLEKFTAQWPRYGFAWYGQQTMASVYTAGQIADALLADAEFRALRLGTWLNTPSGELLTAAVTALTPPPFNQDIELLAEALQFAIVGLLRDKHILQDGEFPEKARNLECPPYPDGIEFEGREAGDVFTFENDRPGIRLVEPANHIDQRRLARPVGAD